MVDFQQQAHAGREGDAFVGGQRQHTVVVHHRIHRLQQKFNINKSCFAHRLPGRVREAVRDLDPLGVDVTVQHNPLVLVGLVVGHVAEGHADDALVPLTRLRVEPAVQLVAGHSLPAWAA